MDEIGYKIYISDCLQLAPQNKYVTIRYADLLVPKKQDSRSGDEIAEQVIRECGLRV